MSEKVEARDKAGNTWLVPTSNVTLRPDGAVVMFTTQWWASDGIVAVLVSGQEDAKLYSGGLYYTKYGVNTFGTPEEAALAMRKLAEKKEASLRKQAEKLHNKLNDPNWPGAPKPYRVANSEV